MKRLQWLIPMTMMVLACDPNTQDPNPDTGVQKDMATDLAVQADVSTDSVSSPDVGIDAASSDTGLSDSGLSDLGSDTGTAPVCIDGPFGVADDGQNVTCEWTVTCDGVDYRVDCLNDVCTCSTDGQASQNVTAETFCSGQALLDCGATEVP